MSSISIACLRGTLRDSATIGVEQNRPISTPGRGEARGFGGDREIAACHQLAAGGGGDALDRGDHRLRQMHDGLHHRAAGIHDLREIGAAAIGIGAARGQFLHVVAGGKSRAVGRDHDRADAVVVVNVLQRRVQFGDQAFRQAVAGRRPVEREHGDAAERLAQQDRRLRRGARAVWASSEISTWVSLG